MNPTVQGLDPKLKETYDRVMGTDLSKTGSPLASEARQGWTQTSKPIESPPIVPSAQPIQAQPAESVPAAAPDTHVYVATPAAPSSSTQTITTEKTRKIPPVVFIVLGIVFFAGYTAVWLKVFGII